MGLYSECEGSSAETSIGYDDGAKQVLKRAFQSPVELEKALYEYPEFLDVRRNTDGSVYVVFEGVEFLLKP